MQHTKVHVIPGIMSCSDVVPALLGLVLGCRKQRPVTGPVSELWVRS
jgi:hypothetical protein